MKLDEIRDFGKKIRALDRRLNEQKKTDTDCDVSLTQCHALLEIEEKKETNVKDLAGSMALDKSTMSRTIDRLVQGGFVERNINSQDRRSMQIKMTKLGRETCIKINQRNDEYFQAVFEELPDEKQKQIMEALNDLLEAMYAVKRRKNGNRKCRPSK